VSRRRGVVAKLGSEKKGGGGGSDKELALRCRIANGCYHSIGQKSSKRGGTQSTRRCSEKDPSKIGGARKA